MLLLGALIAASVRCLPALSPVPGLPPLAARPAVVPCLHNPVRLTPPRCPPRPPPPQRPAPLRPPRLRRCLTRTLRLRRSSGLRRAMVRHVIPITSILTAMDTAASMTTELSGTTVGCTCSARVCAYGMRALRSPRRPGFMDARSTRMTMRTALTHIPGMRICMPMSLLPTCFARAPLSLDRPAPPMATLPAISSACMML